MVDEFMLVSIGIIIIISIIALLFIVDISLKLAEVNREHEKYGNDISGDSFGNYCASSQITYHANTVKCDYSKPVKDLDK